MSVQKPEKVIREFLMRAIRALDGESIRVIAFRGQEILSYAFFFKGQRIVLDLAHISLSVGGINVYQIIDGTIFNALQNACFERCACQSVQDEEQLLEAEEAQEAAKRGPAYTRLAARLERSLGKPRQGRHCKKK